MALAETELLEDNDKIEDLETDESLGEELLGEDENLNLDDDEAEGDESQDDEDEIVLEGDGGSHPEKNKQHGIQKRINKLNNKVVEANEGAEQSSAALKVEKDRNRLLQLALDNQNAPVDGPPNPDDFEDGTSGADFQAANNTYITKEVEKRLQTQQQTTQANAKATEHLEARQREHYDKADALKVKDYDATENAAIAILGEEIINQLISKSDKSPEILYFLGKNPDEARVISEEIKNDPVSGVLRLGRLEAKIKTRPKSKQNPAPNPDEELTGGTMAKTTATDRKLDRLREKAMSGNQKDVSALMNFKKQVRAQA